MILSTMYQPIIKEKYMFFSVIIPIYNPNIERLENCLESIFSQNCEDGFEVILVDDKSPKREFESFIEKQFPLCKVIKLKENVGQGVARQIGIDNAHGDWVTFVDQDDMLNMNALSLVQNYINEFEIECVITTNEMIMGSYDSISYNDPFVVVDQDATIHALYCNRQFLIDNNIKFSDLRHQEDTYFMNVVRGVISIDDRYSHNPNTSASLEIVTYLWYLWEDSTSHTKVNGMDYLEDSFPDYIDANYLSTMEIVKRYPHYDNKYLRDKHVSLFFYCYWFYEAYDYIHPKIDHSIMFNAIKNLKYKMLKDLERDEGAFWDLLYSCSHIYYIVYQSIVHTVEKVPIPNITLKEFYDSL